MHSGKRYRTIGPLVIILEESSSLPEKSTNNIVTFLNLLNVVCRRFVRQLSVCLRRFVLGQPGGQ